MARNFKPCNRDQLLLLPPSLRDWLPKEDLAWFVCAAVGQMDISRFLEGYRQDGRGGSGYHPEILVSLLLYAYCRGITSSRQIEKLCHYDIGFRVVVAQQMPDHATIARFRKDFSGALENLFVQILELCAVAGLVKLGNVALDGTKIASNASMEANLTRKQLRELVEQMLKQAEQTDAAEDELYGKDKRGDELPEDLADPDKRQAALRKARQILERLKQAQERADDKAQLEQQEYEKNKAEYDKRAAKSATGKAAGHEPKPPDPASADEQQANPTDPQSSKLKGRRGFCQGYNAQAVVSTDGQIILCADVCSQSNDMQQLSPMVEVLHQTLQQAGLDPGQIKSFLADSGYWTCQSITEAHDYLRINELNAELLIPPPRKWAKIHERPTDDNPADGLSLLERIEYRTKSPYGRERYKKRRESVEPVFGQILSNRGLNRFRMRGMRLVTVEWKLMTMTHNLLKMWNHQTRQTAKALQSSLKYHKISLTQYTAHITLMTLRQDFRCCCQRTPL